MRYILSSVVDALLADDRKRFTYVEIAFFSRWYAEQTPARQQAVQGLVRVGRLVFVNGGWVMHDEAAAHWSDMADQTALGHAWIADTFGVAALPTVGWQIDPFGHSGLQASVLGPQLGWDAVFLGRAEYSDLARRVRDRALEFRWRAPEGAGVVGRDGAPDFLGLILGSGNYGPPSGFRWDTLADDPVDADPASTGYNVPDVVDRFVAASFDWATRFAGAAAGGCGARSGGDATAEG